MGGESLPSPLCSVSMLSASLRSPSFPPLSEPLSALRSLPWEEIREASFSASLFALALLHALAARLWAQRFALASFLRSLASLLPSPSFAPSLSPSSPRSDLISALASSSGLPRRSFSRLASPRLLSAARSAGLFG